MSLQNTPVSERVHIGLFGRRNAGKSSLMNAITGQDAAMVSDVAGTTTDPVSKTMELLPLGPVVLVDTPGLDDDTELGAKRVQRTLNVLERVDIALLVVDAQRGLGEPEKALIERFSARHLPYLIVYNKADLCGHLPIDGENALAVSAQTGRNIPLLREKISRMKPEASFPKQIVGDLLSHGDVVILVTPIDSAAPKGRLILPQQQTIRDILDAGAQALVTRGDDLRQTLASLSAPPRLVITDSQVFEEVANAIPANIPLTSFSILFARYKGILEPAVEGVNVLSSLNDGDRVLISEGCTHHRQCDDIGTVKLPRWMAKATGKTLAFEFSSGNGFPADLSPYALIVHCGGCMLKDKVVQNRLTSANAQGIPITNYGTLIAHMKGILGRSLAPLA